jgi:hypothetical protein
MASTNDTLIEPEPVWGDKSLTLRIGQPASDPLRPRPEDVVQGAIAACPIAAVMVALAYSRPANLNVMLGPPLKITVLSKRKDEEVFSYWSDWCYDVKFPRAPSAIRVTPMLYFDDSMVQYAATPNGAGWPSYIEKAYAVWKSGGIARGSGGDYSRLALRRSLIDTPTLGEVLEDLVGRAISCISSIKPPR